jgi:hypothetical protein
MLKHPNQSTIHLLKLSCQAKALLRWVPLVCSDSNKFVYFLPNCTEFLFQLTLCDRCLWTIT